MANNREYDYALKLVLIGNATSEKSALSLRYVEDIYNDNLEPLKGFAEFVSIIIYIYIYIYNYKTFSRNKKSQKL